MTMRDDLRTALQSQQSSLGDVADARQRLMHGAMLNRDQPANRSWQWAAAVAAVLIAAIVITTFALVKAGGHTTPVPAATPSPHPQVSPTPLSSQLVVPPGTPVILYHDPANFDQVDGVTWDGRTSGRVGVGATSGGNAAPDGSHYQTLDKAAVSPFWADDSTHYCAVVRTKSRDVTGPGMLQIGSSGQQPRNVAKVGTFGAAGLNAGGPTVVACSPGADRAVVYQSGGQGIGVAEFWVIQLSNGRVLWHAGRGTWIAASHDGRYVALADDSFKSTVYGPNGQVAGRIDGTVFTFSWDASVAVVAPNYGGAPSILDWRDGQTVWTCPKSTYQYTQSLPEPGGTHIAIGAADPAYKNTTGFQPVDLFVVGPDGVVVFEKKDVTLFGQ